MEDANARGMEMRRKWERNKRVAEIAGAAEGDVLLGAADDLDLALAADALAEGGVGALAHHAHGAQLDDRLGERHEVQHAPERPLLVRPVQRRHNHLLAQVRHVLRKRRNVRELCTEQA